MAAVIGTDYTGAVEKAAAVNDSTFGGQALLMLHRFQGALADLGTNMGELLVVFALAGPKLTTALLAGIGGLGGLLVPRLAGLLTADVMPWMTAGTKIGTIIGTAMGPAITIAAVAAVALVWDSINKELNRQADALETQTTDWARTATVAQLEAQREVIAKGAMDIAGMPFGSSLYGDQLASLKRDLDVVNKAIAAETERTYRDSRAPIAAAMSSGVEDGTARMVDLARRAVQSVGGILRAGLNAPVPVDKLISSFGTGLQGVWDAAHNIGHATGVEGMLAMAAGITSARKAPLDAYETMVEMLKTAMTPQAEAARLAGELTSKALSDGLKSKDPAVAAQAIAAKEAILDRLATIAKESGPLGKKAMDELAAGMKSKDPTIRAYAKAAHDTVIAELDKTKDGARLAGEAAGSAFAAGILRVISSSGVTRFISTGGTATGGKLYEGAASGMPYVQRDKPVYVHQAEAILTVPQAEAWRSGQGGRGVAVNIEHVEIRDAHDEFSLIQSLRFMAGVTA
jgi:hypothetical protein